MNLVEYKNIVTQRLNNGILNDSKERMSYACMGLIEETGEIIAELRKPLFKGNFHEKPLDLQSIKSELGDLMWYIALMCKNCNINIEELKNYQGNSNDSELQLRGKIIQVTISMGQVTGQIVENARQEYEINTKKEELTRKMSEQYRNINELASLLNITIEQILDENIRKINSRYNDKGEANR